MSRQPRLVRPHRSARLARSALTGALLGSLVLVSPALTVSAAAQGASGPASPDVRPAPRALSWPPAPVVGAAPGRMPLPSAALGLSGAAGPPHPAQPLPGVLLLAAGPAGEPGGPAAVWTRPVASGYPVSAPYGVPGDWLAGYHTGVDFAVPVGTPVHAVGPGTVVVARYSGDYGNAVVVRMVDGHRVLYAHLSRIAVRVDEELNGGDRVGDSGNTGRSTGPHLHFEVRAGRDYGTDVDPLAYLRGYGVEIG